jgi:hypothetical protein
MGEMRHFGEMNRLVIVLGGDINVPSELKQDRLR